MIFEKLYLPLLEWVWLRVSQLFVAVLYLSLDLGMLIVDFWWHLISMFAHLHTFLIIVQRFSDYFLIICTISVLRKLGGIALNNNSYLMGLAKGGTNKCYGRAGMVPSDINGRDGEVWGENHPFPLTHTFISSSSLDGLMGAAEVICSLTHCRKQNIKYFHKSTARLPQAFLLNWTFLELKSTNMFCIMRCKELSSEVRWDALTCVTPGVTAGVTTSESASVPRLLFKIRIIYTFLRQNFVVKVYMLSPHIFLGWPFTFKMCGEKLTPGCHHSCLIFTKLSTR